MATLDDALAWAARGFRIFPITAMAKTPAIASWQNHASNDPDMIAAWWRDPVTMAERDYNIGVLCNDIVVVDVDVKAGRDGLRSYETNEGHYDTLIVETPSGGMHAYYEGPDSKLAVDILPGIDIRSHNGYVLAPGSFVADADTGIAGDYRVLFDKPLSWVPLAIERLLEKPGQRRAHDEGIDLDTPTAIAQAAAWLERAADIAVEGAGGDNTTYMVAAKLVRDYALSTDMAFELMSRHWNGRCVPPWDNTTLWKKVQNADEYATGQTGAAVSDVMFAGVNVPDPSQYVVRDGALYFGNAIEAGQLPPRPWLVERLLMRQSLTIIGGDGGAGKSMLGLVIAAHNAVGKPMGAYQFTTPRNTIVYNAEDDIPEQSRRLQAICTAYGFDYNEVKARIMLISSDDFPILLAHAVKFDPVENGPHVNHLIGMCAHPDVSLLILDPFVELHGCDESNAVQMRFVMAILRRVARETDTSIILSHHTNKPTGKQDRAGDIGILRGSSAIPNAARVAVTIVPPSDRDKEKYGLREEERFDFVRLDDGKANPFKKSVVGTWFKWDSVRLHNGDVVGVLKWVMMNERSTATRNSVAVTILQAMQEDGVAQFSLEEAQAKLADYDPLYATMSKTERRRRIQMALVQPVSVADGTLRLDRTATSSGVRLTVIME